MKKRIIPEVVDKPIPTRCFIGYVALKDILEKKKTQKKDNENE